VRARAALAIGLLAFSAALLAAAPAGAELGPIQLVSKSITQQSQEAVAPAISADGRYIAFQGVMDESREGVFRLDLQSGEIERVATGAPAGVSPASAPSISADGRYVSFTTNLALDPLDDTRPNSIDVYVADMSTSPPTYELASALDGSTQAMPQDSVAAPRVALSADGREVAFVGGGEVYLRDLDSDATLLVSARRDPISGAIEPGVPVPGGAAVESEATAIVTGGAALSADGSTVAWVGRDLPEQVPLLADEAASIAGLESSGRIYDEPLWRRVADGPFAPTRRIVGGGDPLAPGCPAGGTLANPACQGPFPNLTSGDEVNAASGWLGTKKANAVPQLSADGRMVVVIGNPTEAANVFLVDMAPGLSRLQAVRQLTAQVPVRPSNEAQVTNVEPYVPLNGHVYDVAISPNGREIAFTTARQRFPLAPPNLVGAPPTQLGLVELYVIDLETESLRRVSHGYGGAGEASLTAGIASGRDGEGASAPSFGAGGRLIAFASIASNLVEGDGNEGGEAGPKSDVFLVEDTAAAAGRARSATPAVPGTRVRPRRRLALSGFSLPNGDVKVVAVAPVGGHLSARAKAPLGRRPKPKRVSAGATRARADKPATIVLALPRRFRHLARSREGLYATARVSLRARSGKPLSGKLQVHFRAHLRKGGGGGR
jgi:Tol biopolymer transport system component